MLFATRSLPVRLEAVGAKRQQASVAPVAAGVEFDAQLAHGVHAEAYRPFGEPGLHAGGEALGPFLGLGLGGVALAKVAVDVMVAQVQPCMAVGDEVGQGRRGQGEGRQPRS